MGNHTFKSWHRLAAERAAIAGVIPLAIAIACAGTALAAPEQPGVGVGEVEQPGIGESKPQPDAAPAPVPDEAAAPAPDEAGAPRQYWIAPPVEYDNVPTRTVPTYYDEATVAPASPAQLHLPEPVAPVAPIEAPRDMLRLGDFTAGRPNWLSNQDLDKTNNSAAAAEAQMATFWRSIGIEASRSDKVAAATIAGATAGGLGSAVVVGIPAAVAGGAAGAAIGGATAFPGMIGLGLLGLPLSVPGGVIGVTGGAAIGAAAAGIPTAVVAGTVGAIVGGVAGAAFGAGDAPSDPVEFVLPDAPVVDPGAITAATRQTVAQVEAMPGGPEAVAAVRNAADSAPRQVDQISTEAAARIDLVRTVAVAHPAGAGVALHMEIVDAELNRAFKPTVGAVGDILNAVHAGLAA